MADGDGAVCMRHPVEMEVAVAIVLVLTAGRATLRAGVAFVARVFVASHYTVSHDRVGTPFATVIVSLYVPSRCGARSFTHASFTPVQFGPQVESAR